MDDTEAGQHDTPTASRPLGGTSRLPAAAFRSNTVCPAVLSNTRERLAWEEFIVGVGPLSRIAYARAVRRFLEHVESLGLAIASVTPRHVADYIDALAARPGHRQHRPARPMSVRTRKQHLAAIRHFCHHLVQRHAAMINPAASVRSPRLSVERGETLAVSPEHVRLTLAAIDTCTLIGQRDHAIISVLSFTAARVGAVATLTRGSVRFASDSSRSRDGSLLLEEKNAKRRRLPLTGELREVLCAWLQRIGPGTADQPLFMSMCSGRRMPRALTPQDILRMVRRRLAAAGFSDSEFSCHSFRAGAATALLESGLELTRVQDLLGHADPRTTRMYDARSRQVQSDTLDRLTRLMAG